MKRVILHCDLNCFFASVEMLYHPEFRQVPMAVAGDPKDRHGIILAKNVPAKRKGIKTAETINEALRKCPELIIRHPDYETYEYFANKVRELYYDYTDRIEPFGIDECWLDITGSIAYFGSIEKIVNDLLYRVKNEIGLTLSIGISYNKVYAKLGSDLASEDSCCYIDSPSDIAQMSADKLLFVGPQTSERLRSYGISTIGDITARGEACMEAIMGKAGITLYRYGAGLDDAEVAYFHEETQPLKSLGHSMTSIRDLYDLDDVKMILTVISETIAQRLHEQGLYFRTVQLQVRNNQMKVRSLQTSLKENTDLARDIYDHALKLFEDNCSFAIPYRSIGVIVSGLSPYKQYAQTSLFEKESYSLKRRKEESAIEEIRRRFGPNAIGRLRVMEDPELCHFEMKNCDLFYNGPQHKK